jgi:hypothetical protein
MSRAERWILGGLVASPLVILAAFGLWALFGLAAPEVLYIDHGGATSLVVHSRLGVRAPLRSALTQASEGELALYDFAHHHLAKQPQPRLNWFSYLLTVLGPPKRCRVETSLASAFVPDEERFAVACYQADADSTTSFAGERTIIAIYVERDGQYQLLGEAHGIANALAFVARDCPVWVAAERWSGNRLLWGQYTHYRACHANTF